jgi:hypothetical protein
LRDDWNIVKDWSETTRYETGRRKGEADELLTAITDPVHGILSCISKYWEQDVQNGSKLIEALQQKRFPISAAFWLNAEDANEWRLVIVSPLVSSGDARLAYRTVAQALAETRVPIPLENISVSAQPVFAINRSGWRARAFHPA